MISAKTRLYGVIGHPVTHSLSPVIINRAFNHLGFDGVYLAFDILDPAEAARAMRALSMGGLSVTIPHKEAIMAHLDEVKGEALEIGAVNTVVNRDGRLMGFNTDWLGATQALTEAMGPIEKRLFLLLGAGGAAKAVAYGLKKSGARFLVAARNEEKGKALAQRFDGLFVPFSQARDFNAHGIINATPFGMGELKDMLPIPAEGLDKVEFVLDTVYSPPETRLLIEAQKRGAYPISGIRMLLFQALEQVRLFTGESVPLKVMEDALSEWNKTHGDKALK